MIRLTEPYWVKKYLLACFFSLLSGLVQSASLGRINVQSSLGEAFQAEVELLNLAQDETASLQVRTASADVFRRNGLDFNPVVSNIKATLVNEANRSYINLRSNEGIPEPMFDLLLEVSSERGIFTKKFTLLLDPPLSKQSAADQANQAAMANAVQNYSSGTLRLKPSFNLNLTNLDKNLSKKEQTSTPKKLSKREKRAFDVAERQTARLAASQRRAQDRLSVSSPVDLKSPVAQETPQTLARRLVKSGMKDPAQIEALIVALNAAKTSTEQKPVNASTPVVSNSAPIPSTAPVGTVPSVVNLPPAVAGAPLAVADTPLTPPKIVIAPVVNNEKKSNSWLSFLASTVSLFSTAIVWPLLVVLALLGWLVFRRRKNIQEDADIEDYPMTEAIEPKVNPAQAEMPKNSTYPAAVPNFKRVLNPAARVLQEPTRIGKPDAFESQFLTQIKIDESLLQSSSIEPIEHAKQLINQGDTENAVAFLSSLLHDKPDDQSVRVMLISLLIAKNDALRVEEHMAILGTISGATGESWYEAKKHYLAYKAKQNYAAEVKASKPVIAKASNTDLATLDLDLSHPTQFSPPSHSYKNSPSPLSLTPLEFTLADEPKALDMSQVRTVGKVSSSNANSIELVSIPVSVIKADVQEPSLSNEDIVNKLAQVEALLNGNQIDGAQAIIQSLKQSRENRKK